MPDIEEMLNIKEEFNLRKGEIIIIRLEDISDEERKEEIKELIKLVAEEQEINEPFVLFLSKYESLAGVSEIDLNSYGWYRKEQNIIQNKMYSRASV